LKDQHACLWLGFEEAGTCCAILPLFMPVLACLATLQPALNALAQQAHVDVLQSSGYLPGVPKPRMQTKVQMQ